MRAVDLLAEAGVDQPRYDAESLLGWVLGVSRTRAMATGPITEADRARFRALVERRRRREPLQHIVGTAPFRYLDLEVGPGVFVPRPETEVLAGVAIDELRRLIQASCPRPRAVDLCTGSGAIALAMATEVPGARVTAVEVAEDAYSYAARNDSRVGAGIDLRLGDSATAADDLRGCVQVVTANPPYIPLEAFESVAAEAREFDPPIALWSGPDGLDAIRMVAGVAARLLTDGGLVLCEHADAQGESAPQIFAESGDWHDVRDNVDLAGRPRFVSARRAGAGAGGPGTMFS